VNKTGGIRGRPIHFAVTDVQSSPVVTLQVATPILARHPAVIIGPDSTAQTNALLPLLASHQTVVYSMSVAFVPAPGSDVFVVGIGNFDLYTSAVRFLRRKGITRLGVISTTDASGVDQIQQIERVVALPENRGVSIVGREAFGITDLNVTAQLTRLKASNPQSMMSAVSSVRLVPSARSVAAFVRSAILFDSTRTLSITIGLSGSSSSTNCVASGSAVERRSAV
jgi:branched-chain amino acid transport system substrate-binding protein